MSAVVGMLVTLGVLAIAGSRGRPVGSRARDTPGNRPAHSREAPDLSAVLLGVCAQLRAGATAADAWSRATGVPAVRSMPTVDLLLDLSARRPTRRHDRRRRGSIGHGGSAVGGSPVGSVLERPAPRPSLLGCTVLGRFVLGRFVLGRSHDGAEQRVRAVLAATRLSDDLGAPLAGVLERIASAVAADEEAEGERRAALAGPRSTAQVLAWLPLLGVALGALLGANPVAVVLSGGIGTATASLGVVLLVVGRWWTSALLSHAGRAADDHGRASGSLAMLVRR